MKISAPDKSEAEMVLLLEENDIDHVNMDGPPLKGLLPRQELVTS